MYHSLPECSLIARRSPGERSLGFLKRTLITCGILVLGLVWLSTGALGSPVSKAFEIKFGFAAKGYSSNQRFSRPGGVFFDKNRNEIYVADTSNSQIVIFDNNGTPLAKIPHSVIDSSSNERKPGQPKSVVVRKNGDVLVVDNLCNYVDVLDYGGQSIYKLWPADLLGLQRSKVRPLCMAIDASENLYVAVGGEVEEILVLTPELTLKAEIGKLTDKDGPRGVNGLWVDKDGKIYATHAQGDCVRIYAPDGRVLTTFGKHDSGYENFSLPSGLTTDAQGNIWIVDTLRHAVTVFKQEPDGSGIKTSVIHGFGGFIDIGELVYPCAIAGDGVGRIVVVENAGARLQAFDVLFKDSTGKAKTTEQP